MRPSMLYSAGSSARAQARRAIATADIHPVETHVLRTLTRAGGWVAEHIDVGRWRLNGIEIDRLLFVTIGFHVRTGKPLPDEWLAKVSPERAAA